MKRELFVFGIIVFLFEIVMAEDSTYTHIKGFSEFSFTRQNVSGTFPGYDWLPYGNRNNRTNLNIESFLGNDLYFSGNIVADQTALQGDRYSFALRHKFGMAKIGQFSPDIDILPDKTIMKGAMLKGNFANNEVEGQYFYDNIIFVNEKIEGNGTQGPFKLKSANIKNGSESVELIDDKGARRELKRGNDYTINYLSGEIELKNIILESPCQLVVSYKTEGMNRCDIKEAKYKYDNSKFNIYLQGIEEGISDADSFEINKNIGLGGKYNNGNFNAGVKLGRSSGISTMPMSMDCNIDYSSDNFHTRALFRKKNRGYSMIDSSEEFDYGVQSGYSNRLMKIDGKYDYSYADSVKVKRIELISGINLGKNSISYNYSNLWMDNYKSEKHFIKLSSGLSCCEFNISSGIGNMKVDSVKNRNYFVNGALKILSNVNLELNTENRYEIYRDSVLYRYKQFISMEKLWHNSGITLNVGLLNNNMGENIPYGAGKADFGIMNLGKSGIKFNIKRINGKIDSLNIPVNRIDAFPEIGLKFGPVKMAYTPELHWGIYGNDGIQEKMIRNIGSAGILLGKLSASEEYCRYSNINYDLNDLKSRKTDNYGVSDLFSVKGNVSSTFSTGYSFEYKRDNGLYNIIIPTITDTSGDTLDVIKISTESRHNFIISFKKGKSQLNMKSGYETNNEYHSDTL
ncbi:MAG: hypothetical protein GWP03_06380, partial [Proteobacteria bacterium]|nr:hypothetical protein [Pseudomonadota bacterium]